MCQNGKEQIASKSVHDQQLVVSIDSNAAGDLNPLVDRNLFPGR